MWAVVLRTGRAATLLPASSYPARVSLRTTVPDAENGGTSWSEWNSDWRGSQLEWWPRHTRWWVTHARRQMKANRIDEPKEFVGVGCHGRLAARSE